MERHETTHRPSTVALPLFLAGAVIGAVAGILLAPDSGKETRRRLGAWAKDKGQKGKEALLDRKDRLIDAVDMGRKVYRDEKDIGKKLADV